MIARSKQIERIEKFVTTKMDQKSSGLLYLYGPPGTGKTMCVQHVLNTLETTKKYKHITKVDINCMRMQTAKSILAKICQEVGLAKQVSAKTTEAEMISKLTKKISSRTSETCLFILDEIDKLPKSRNLNLIRTIFSWPSLPLSKLVLVGISNTFSLTSRMETLNSLLGTDTSAMEKIIFRPYTIGDIKMILTWYLENDENYQDAEMDPKALDMICKKFARENGDIRGALNACKTILDDAIRSAPSLATLEQTPKAKARATLVSTATSIKKKQKNTNYEDDVFPLIHQLALFSITHLITSSKLASIDFIKCYSFFLKLGRRFDMTENKGNFRFVLETLESQGLIRLKKSKNSDKIALYACESEINARISRRELILDAMKNIHVLNTQTFTPNARLNSIN